MTAVSQRSRKLEPKETKVEDRFTKDRSARAKFEDDMKVVSMTLIGKGSAMAYLLRMADPDHRRNTFVFGIELSKT